MTTANAVAGLLTPFGISWRTLAITLLLLVSGHAANAQICTSSVTTPVFANYRATGADTAANGSVSVSCVVLGVTGQSVSYTVKLELGAQSLGTQRRMLSGGQYLRYNVYCDSGLQNVWADGGASTCVQTGGQAGLLGTLLTVFPVYGNIPAGQFVPAGIYTDTIAVQVLY